MQVHATGGKPLQPACRRAGSKLLKSMTARPRADIKVLADAAQWRHWARQYLLLSGVRLNILATVRKPADTVDGKILKVCCP